MKKISQLFVIGILITIVFSACTMEKRLYSSGYNVNWIKAKQKVQKENGEKNQIKTEIESNSITANNGDDLFLETEKNTTVLELYPSKIDGRKVKTDIKKITKQKKIDLLNAKEINNNIKNIFSTDKPYADEPKVELLGLIGFILFAFAILMALLLIPSLIYGPFGFAGLVLSIISIRKHTKEFGMHKGAIFPLIVLWFEVIGLYLVCLGLLLGILLSILFSAAFLGGGALILGLLIGLLLFFAVVASLLLWLILKYGNAKRSPTK